MDISILYFSLAILLCFLMTWGVGANDLANVMSTTMGSKAISVKQALCVAVIFEFLGAFLGGTDVTATLRDGIIDVQLLADQPTILIEGMLGVLMACMIWMHLASFMGVPVSITNALVGSMVGFGWLVLGKDAVHWHQVSRIAIGWVTSPLIAGTTAYALFLSIQQTIFVQPNVLERAKRFIPMYLFLVGSVLSFITVFKVLAHFNIQLTLKQSILVTLGTSMVITLFGAWVIRRIPERPELRRRERFKQVEKYFAVLMAMTACAMVFAHGANDVALAVAPLSMVHSLIMHADEPFRAAGYPAWIVLLGATGAVIGFLVQGRRVIETVGSSITALTPSRAFAATLSAATTVVAATSMGIPVSATQTLVGSVLGVGLARGIGALNLIVIRNIFSSWILTLPAACILTILSYKALHAVLG